MILSLVISIHDYIFTVQRNLSFIISNQGSIFTLLLNSFSTMRPKGRLVVPRKGNKIGRDNYLKRATASAQRKLEIDKFNQLKANYSALAAASIVKQRKLEDGLIMSLIQQNMSFDEIRAMFKCGNSRIKRVRDIMEDPTVLDKKRPTPKHALKKDDITALKEHLSTYETEDGFPCAHRRARKFFIVQGLT